MFGCQRLLVGQRYGSIMFYALSDPSSTIGQLIINILMFAVSTPTLASVLTNIPSAPVDYRASHDG
jgi:hypothetical protein